MPYRLEPDKPALMYEVYLPKRHEAKLRPLLDTLFDTDKLRQLPCFAMLDSLLNGMQPTTSEQRTAILRYFDDLSRLFVGYSTYLVNGRFRSDDGNLMDEETLVVRFIFHDPRNAVGIGGDFRANVEQAIRYVVTYQLAEATGVEEEVWCVEAPVIRLTRALR